MNIGFPSFFWRTLLNADLQPCLLAIVMPDQIFFVFSRKIQIYWPGLKIIGIWPHHVGYRPASDDHSHQCMCTSLPVTGKAISNPERCLPLPGNVYKVPDDCGMFVCDIPVQHLDQFCLSMVSSCLRWMRINPLIKNQVSVMKAAGL
jgi:hypothetical protein